MSADRPIAAGRRAPHGRSDHRLPALIALAVGIAGIGFLVGLIPGRGTEAKPPAVGAARDFTGLSEFDGLPRAALPDMMPREVAVEPGNPHEAEMSGVFGQAASQLKAKQYDQAIATLDSARELARAFPEAYLLLGRALEGKKDYAQARDFYLAAIDRAPWLADAHWGFATTSEALGDLESALGGMRSYLHTEPDPDPQRLRISQARSAIWEWEAKLGRGPWGPTRGVPPDFKPEEVVRDGRGVGVKIPKEETRDARGNAEYEIKHAEKIKIYPRP